MLLLNEGEINERPVAILQQSCGLLEGEWQGSGTLPFHERRFRTKLAVGRDILGDRCLHCVRHLGGELAAPRHAVSAPVLGISVLVVVVACFVLLRFVELCFLLGGVVVLGLQCECVLIADVEENLGEVLVDHGSVVGVEADVDLGVVVDVGRATQQLLTRGCSTENSVCIPRPLLQSLPRPPVRVCVRLTAFCLSRRRCFRSNMTLEGPRILTLRLRVPKYV